MFRTSGSFRLCFTAPQMAKASWGCAMISIQSCLLPSLGQRMSLSSLFSWLSALCLNQSPPCRNVPRLLWNDGESSRSWLSKIKTRDKTCFVSQMGAPAVTSGLVGGVPAHVGGLELDFYKVFPSQTILIWSEDVILKGIHTSETQSMWTLLSEQRPVLTCF